MSRLQAAVAIRKQQHRIAVHLPETAQQIERCRRQGNETVFVAFGIADMDALTVRIDIYRLLSDAVLPPGAGPGYRG